MHVRLQEPAPRTGAPGRLAGFLITLTGVGALFLYYLAMWPDLKAFSHDMDWAPRPFEDFLVHYQPMAERILREPISTDGYFYPAFLAVALHPIAALGPQVALKFWVALTIAMTLLGWWASCGLLGLKRPGPRLVLLLLTLSAQPVLHCFNWGQVSIMLGSLTLVSCRSSRCC
ncbi:DUF2029 domain-containing protein [Naumannella sp. ID2617S]|nr:DUF2029 domain-containing protein [Naumannella sp. ID2617S]